MAERRVRLDRCAFGRLATSAELVLPRVFDWGLREGYNPKAGNPAESAH